LRLGQLEREHDNLRAAMRWSLEWGEAGQDAEMALRFGAALRRFWVVHGNISEGRAFLERALVASKGAEAAVRAKGLATAASLAVYQNDMDRAEASCQESLVQSRACG